MLCPGMLRWWDLASGQCRENPQVTSGHRLRHVFLGFLSIHHFLNKSTQAVFSMIPVTFWSWGSPYLLYLVFNFSFSTNGSGPKTLPTLEGDFYNKCVNRTHVSLLCLPCLGGPHL